MACATASGVSPRVVLDRQARAALEQQLDEPGLDALRTATASCDALRARTRRRGGRRANATGRINAMRVHLGLVIALSVVSSCGGSAVSTATPPPARVEAPQGELSFRPIERAEWVVGCSDYAIETRVGGARPVVRQVPAPGAREEVLLRSLASLRYRRPTGRRARLLRDQRWISVAVDRVVHFRAHEGISSVAVAGTAATAHWTGPEAGAEASCPGKRRPAEGPMRTGPSSRSELRAVESRVASTSRACRSRKRFHLASRSDRRRR
jgi:hypothetical protein